MKTALVGVKNCVLQGRNFYFQIYYWGQSRLNARRRREIPAYALSVNVPGGTTTSHTVKGLTPYTNYNFAITAYNSGGEGPASDEAFAATDEDSKLQIETFRFQDEI